MRFIRRLFGRERPYEYLDRQSEWRGRNKRFTTVW